MILSSERSRGTEKCWKRKSHPADEQSKNETLHETKFAGPTLHWNYYIQYVSNNYVLSFDLKSNVSMGFLRSSGRLFQIFGPAT